MLGYLHHVWHQFGARCSYLMSGFCTVVSTHQEIRPKLLAFFCLENYLHLKARNVTHTITHALHRYFSALVFLVRNCVGQQGS